MTTTRAKQQSVSTGWLAFAGTMLLIAGGFNLISGIAAAAADDRYAINRLLFGNLELWGWVMIGFGLAQLFTAYTIYTAKQIGLTLGVAFAVLNIFWQLMFLGVYPLWSLSVIVIDLLIIYGLTVYGDRNPV